MVRDKKNPPFEFLYARRIYSPLQWENMELKSTRFLTKQLLTLLLHIFGPKNIFFVYFSIKIKLFPSTLDFSGCSTLTKF